MNQRAIIVGIIVGFIIFLTLSPIIALLYGSLSYDILGESFLTLDKYVQAYSDPLLAKIVVDTVIYAAGSAMVATSLALFLAYLNIRTNAPLKRLYHFISIAPIMIPHVLFCVAWIILLNPTNGIVNEAVRSLLGSRVGPLNVYSMFGMAFVEGLLDMPVSYLVIAASLMSLDTSLEESSRICGAHSIVTFFRITLPILRPAIGAAFVLVLVRALASFAAPATIGLPSRIYVLATLIYRKISLGFAPDYGEAAALGVGLLAVSAAIVYAYSIAVSRVDRFVTITGRGHRSSLVDLGKWKCVASGLAIVVLLLVVVLPILVLAYTSLLPFYVVPGEEALEMFSFSNWWNILKDSRALMALSNSIFLAASGASAGIVISFAVAYVTLKTRTRGRGFLQSLAFLPFSFPGLVVGVGFVWAWIRTPLYGTIWALFLAYLATYLPYGLLPLTSSLVQIHNELEESSRIVGASFRHTLRKVLLPLLAPAFVSGWILLAMTFLRELSVSAVLSRPGSEVAAVYILRLADDGRWGPLSAFGLVMIAISIALVLLVRRMGPPWAYAQ